MSQYENKRQAAAIRYDQEREGSAPVVVASGMGYLAEKMVEVAQQNNVPVYQDDSLASLLSQLKAGAEIPVELYQAIVDIYLYFLHFTPSGQAEKTDTGEDK